MLKNRVRSNEKKIEKKDDGHREDDLTSSPERWMDLADGAVSHFFSSLGGRPTMPALLPQYSTPQPIKQAWQEPGSIRAAGRGSEAAGARGGWKRAGVAAGRGRAWRRGSSIPGRGVSGPGSRGRGQGCFPGAGLVASFWEAAAGSASPWQGWRRGRAEVARPHRIEGAAAAVRCIRRPPAITARARRPGE